MEIKQYLEIYDIAWISSKMKGEFLRIKLSDSSELEKRNQINILMQRAKRFGFDELVQAFGFTTLKIPLGEGREAEIVYPQVLSKKDKIEMYKKTLIHLEALSESLNNNPTP